MNHFVHINKELVEIGRSDCGWTVLYLDKSDGRFWELTYPNCGEHGSGGPSMELLPRSEITNKYKVVI